MLRLEAQLRADALAIWQAGLAAVAADRLVAQHLVVDGSWLLVADQQLPWSSIGQICVVGAGKAGAGMAAAVEHALGPELAKRHQLHGLVNVPADCVRKLTHIRLHAARPAGANEPRAEGVAGAQAMLDMLARMGPNDLCLALVSGGGSALLPAPVEGVPLAEKLALTRYLSTAGADIVALNTVRKQLSRIKGGGLARACRAGTLVTLIISDVPGDPLDVIASGPTVPDSSTPADALRVLSRFDVPETLCPRSWSYLRRRASPPPTAAAPAACRVLHQIIGNNATAVDAAGLCAERLGYAHAMHCARAPEGEADDQGRHLASLAQSMRATAGPDCLVSGGEPVVTIGAGSPAGRGGRNQQLALAALVALWRPGCTGLALVSGGTDGEDGPTDAAGAIVDQSVWRQAMAAGLEPAAALAAHDAYPLFEAAGGLLKTGPTHTNVGDLRVLVVDRQELAGQ